MNTITGKVEQRNERGLRVGGQWYNMSRWPSPDSLMLEEVQPGQTVTLELDRSQFIRRIEVVEPAKPNGAPAAASEANPMRRATPEWVRAESLRIALEIYKAMQPFPSENAVQTDKILAELLPLADEIHGYLCS